MMKKTVFSMIAILTVSLLLVGCGTSGHRDAEKEDIGYQQISQEKAMEMMKSEKNYLIVDVRTPEEYAAGYIKHAINIPNETIDKEGPKQLKDKDRLIFVYCRSGNRSKEASDKLARMGYTKVYEMGGINTWKGDIVKGK